VKSTKITRARVRPSRLAITVAFACSAFSIVTGVTVTWSRGAFAQTVSATPDTSGTKSMSAATTVAPPLDTPYLQYGIAIATEFVAGAGKMCSAPGVPCILGSGGGVVVRVGRRSAGPWYFGGAYELSKQDPNQLYRLAILQQLRGETRYYFPTGWDTSPFVSGGLGVAVYGNEGAIDTVAPSIFAAVGAETQLSRRMVVGVALAYRLLYFTAFTDSSGTARSAGLAQVVGLDLSLEARDPR